MNFAGLKEKLSSNKGRTLLGAAMVVLIIACITHVALFLRPEKSPANSGIYFADEETGEFSVQSLTAIPPLNNAAGRPTLVRACLYSTDGGKTKTVAYYAKYSDEAKAMMEASAGDPSKYSTRLFQTGHLVRKPEPGSPWVSADSDAGRRILSSIPTGDNVTPCSVVPP